MADVGVLFEAIELVFSWPAIGWLVVGILFGTILGVIPGLGPGLGMAIVLPFTLLLDGFAAVVLLMAIYLGTTYGGCVTAILINTPGTAQAAATCLDGYPMSRQGKAKEALVISAASSSIGGIIAGLGILALTPVLVTIVLLFGSPEYFLVALLGISLIAIVSRGEMVKGLTAGAFGLLLSTIGYPVASGQPRFTFGSFMLYDGISFIAVLIGLFAIGEMIKLSAETGGIAESDFEIEGPILPGLRTVLNNPITQLKSGVIGGLVGAVPGAGASISNFVSYAEAVRSDSGDVPYGDGNPKGVMASEGANNATVFGALVPTLSFGIPGSGSTAILLGGLLMHGIRPGPQLFETELQFTQGLVIALMVGCVVIGFIGVFLVSKLAAFTKIDTNYIIPIIVVLALVGSLTFRNNFIDIFTVVLFGIIGFIMVKNNFSIVALVLGVVLGPIAEENLIRSLQLSQGSLDIFVSEPLSIFLVLLIVVAILSPFIDQLMNKV
ncbi:tripartite tricarboxylate transporter permease [Halobellus salinisoli]|uniref:tripartite tricarboxylate transporter permease n=1 Tax=Halobellus salinisoli TaxID=3108500 RepID=UPI003009BCEB